MMMHVGGKRLMLLELEHGDGHLSEWAMAEANMHAWEGRSVWSSDFEKQP